ncbi:MAG: 4-hydroxy-tetrahydrodipicolinate synthase [Rhodospirillaceae bacterium]|jgi:4-hydroxy-tetrahydrodipicolinate synthase|nr:4-hydroxy-tetrahydrodipicolinate synthase [Rhodospirillaceae bacterium]
MTNTERLNGIFTAIVTPFHDNGEIDWKNFDALIERQLAANIAGLVPVGTTGEAATLSEDEALAIIERTVKRVDGKAYVLAGTGSNATDKAIKATKRAAEVGVDGVLLVSPYYNKPSQKGIVAHFEAVADCADIDNVLYSVPGRTGMAIEADTVAALSRSRRNIVGIKEAGGDPLRVTALKALCEPGFIVHCGDDALALPFFSLGASGLTSVLSNYDPELCVALYDAWRSSENERACALHDLMAPIAAAMFIECSPSAVKCSMAMDGLISEKVRLPLVELQDESRNVLAKTIKGYRTARKEVFGGQFG